MIFENPLLIGETYIICYNNPDLKDLFFADNNKPIKEDDWIYVYYQIPETIAESYNSCIKLKKNDSVFIINIKKSNLCVDTNNNSNAWMVSFVAQNGNIYHVQVDKHAEIVDPSTFVTFCKFIHPEKVNRSKNYTLL